ncbi:MAG TPA: DUF4147 domain-containing protein [Candidatus Jorgensenbacteria bacterium]|uniref:MOFRL domain-containing protein n=1 Tax=marine sediment metagenome TaxID=412755 RepID=A0A0F9L9K6_9ZZZZ|nr:DUF4147 domain-containing protein [Candidatus Jorgensenbacteria bacterium]
MRIQNRDALAHTPLRVQALAVIEAGFAVIDTDAVVRRNVAIHNDSLSVGDKSFPLKDIRRLIVVGVGKCASEAAYTLEQLLGDRIDEGIVLDVQCRPRLQHITFYKGTHPFPSRANSDATERIIALLKDAGEGDVVIFIISGGGSTLLHTEEDISTEDERCVLKHLFASGATIQEINTIRKHLSHARAGFLARYAYPARSAALIFSDVPTNDPQFIASGPTVRDITTVADAQAVLERYDVYRVCPLKTALIDTPQEDRYFAHAYSKIVVSNKHALDAMVLWAQSMGFTPRICTTSLAGEAREMGKRIIDELHTALPHTALLYGGETTVKLTGDGTGGRNQELVLACVPYVEEGELIVSVASDGNDNTDVAGALCDTITKERARVLSLDAAVYLQKNDSYHFFEQVGDHIVTGHTGSNVSDIVLAIKL